MLLNELQGVKRFQKYDFNQILRLLERFGIELIGAGRFGQVFSNPKWNYVVKVFRNDPHYLDFINFVAKHPNPHYPKVVRRPLSMHTFYRRWKAEGNRLWIVKIEKLNEITNTGMRTFLEKELDNGAHAIRVGRSNTEILTNKRSTYGHYKPDGVYEYNVSWNDMFKRYPRFHSLCEALAKIQDQGFGTPDIHAENLMQRKDGTIVIIDPVWAGYNPYMAFDEAMKRETDYYGNMEDEPAITGPDYAQPKPPSREQLARNIAHEFDDDIPF